MQDNVRSVWREISLNLNPLAMMLLSKVRDNHDDASSRLLDTKAGSLESLWLAAQKTISGTSDAHQNYLCFSPVGTCGYQHRVQSELVQAELILTSALVG